jgi:hypothetical protein
MPPAGQPRPAPRALQATSGESLFHCYRVRSYRDHRASARKRTALPRTPARNNSGRAVAYPDPKIVTVSAATTQINTTHRRGPHRHAKQRGPAATSASSSTAADTYPQSSNGRCHRALFFPRAKTSIRPGAQEATPGPDVRSPLRSSQAPQLLTVVDLADGGIIDGVLAGQRIDAGVDEHLE